MKPTIGDRSSNYYLRHYVVASVKGYEPEPGSANSEKSFSKRCEKYRNRNHALSATEVRQLGNCGGLLLDGLARLLVAFRNVSFSAEALAPASSSAPILGQLDDGD